MCNQPIFHFHFFTTSINISSTLLFRLSQYVCDNAVSLMKKCIQIFELWYPITSTIMIMNMKSSFKKLRVYERQWLIVHCLVVDNGNERCPLSQTAPYGNTQQYIASHSCFVFLPRTTVHCGCCYSRGQRCMACPLFCHLDTGWQPLKKFLSTRKVSRTQQKIKKSRK